MTKPRFQFKSPTMLPVLAGLALASVWFGLFLAWLAPWTVLVPEEEDPANAKELKAGQLFIVGNTHTSDHLIRECLQVYPGSTFTKRELQEAEWKLCRLRLFKCDPQHGIGPTVKLIDGESDFRDIIVQVQELPGNELLCAALEWRLAVVLGDIDGLRQALERFRRGLEGKL
ncbi:MAG: hypothetical protein HY040_20670 [Planctomycetes bacterium]|nr:hypothetical protein [Planctomycetota bacterium]